MSEVDFPLADLGRSAKPVQRRVYQIGRSEQDSDWQEKRLHARPGDLQIGIGEAESQLPAEVLLQARASHSSTFDLGAANQVAFVLAARLGHEGIRDRFNRNLFSGECD